MRVFCISSGKGGVGKTTLTVNLGITMAKAGKRVLLLDADLGLANINVLLKVKPQYTIYEVIRGERTMAEVITKTPFKIDLIAGASGIPELAELSAHERERFLDSLEQISDYDILIIDTGAGISRNVTQFLLAADEVLIVSTPDPASMTDAYGLIKTVLKEDQRPLNLIVNRAGSPATARRVADRLSEVTQKFVQGSLEYLGHVPKDPLIEKSGISQKPHVLSHPRAASSRAIEELVSKLLAQPISPARVGFIGLLKKLLLRENKRVFSDESLYEIVGNEVASGVRRSGLWTMALTQAEWDERKAKTLYIKLRVDQVHRDLALAAENGWEEGPPSEDAFEYLRRPISLASYVRKHGISEKKVANAIALGKLRAYIDNGHFWVEDQGLS